MQAKERFVRAINGVRWRLVAWGTMSDRSRKRAEVTVRHIFPRIPRNIPLTRPNTGLRRRGCENFARSASAVDSRLQNLRGRLDYAACIEGAKTEGWLS